MSNDVSFAPRRTTISPVLGGIVALSYPMVLIAVALSVGFRRGGDMGEFAATIAASVLFVIAAPTAWALSFSFVDVTRFTVIVFGVVTSAPLWYIAGVALARVSEHWVVWARRYLAASFGWTAFNLLVFAVIASFG